MSLSVAIEQIEAARSYTERLLEGLAAEDWFRMPQPAVTHLAWQVGHLAVAEYRLGTVFLRAEQSDDAAWFPPIYRPLFGRDSRPSADASRYPPIEEILGTFQTVHERVLAELRRYNEADLDAPALQPHLFVTTKREAVFWLSRHESVHAGQIALLRRLLGRPPQW
jgi:hypothetical protein